MSPYDCRIANFILEHKYDNHATYDQVMDLYSNMLPYSVRALETVAASVEDQPDQYEKLMLQAVKLNPACYYPLSSYALEHHEEAKAAQYYDQASETDPDGLIVASVAVWRVRYYLKIGQTEKAGQIAAEGGQVYSSQGLQGRRSLF